MLANFPFKESVSSKQIVSKWNIILENYLYRGKLKLLLFVDNILLVFNNNKLFYVS